MRKYLRIRLKLILFQVPRVLLISLLLLLFVAVFAAHMLSDRESDERNEKISLGIVGNLEESRTLRLGLYALETFDQSQHTVELLPMSEEEARKALHQGEISAYILIPDDFITAVGSYADDHPIRYVTTDGAAGIGAQLIDEIISALSTLLLDTQSAVYGMQRIVYSIDETAPVDQLGDQMIVRYGTLAFGRENLYALHLIGETDELSLSGEITVGMLTLFLFLWGIALYPLYTGEDPRMYGLLKTRLATGGLKQISCEITAQLLLQLLCVSLIGLVLYAGNQFSGFVKELTLFSLTDFALFLLRLIPALILISVMHRFVYEAFSSTLTRMTGIFVFSILMGYLSGFFYPTYYFPELITKTGALLPAGAVRSYMAALMLRHSEGLAFAKMLGWTLFFLGITTALRRRKICAG